MAPNTSFGFIQVTSVPEIWNRFKKNCDRARAPTSDRLFLTSQNRSPATSLLLQKCYVDQETFTYFQSAARNPKFIWRYVIYIHF